MTKPIKIFHSPTSGRLYASRAYKLIKVEDKAYFEITGIKDDITESAIYMVHQLEVEEANRNRDRIGRYAK